MRIITNNPATSAQHPHLVKRRVKTWSEPSAKAEALHKQQRFDVHSVHRKQYGYFPSGGGIWGSTGNTTTGSFLNLGEASQAAILKLGRPIMVPVRQNFGVQAQWFTVGSTNGLTGINSGATEDEKVIMFNNTDLRVA